MKTRIISAAVIIALAIAVITIGKLYSPVVITVFLAVICAIGIYELLHNAAGIEQKPVCFAGSFYGALLLFLIGTVSPLFSSEQTENYKKFAKFPVFVTIIYFFVAVCLVLKNHKTFSLQKIVSLTAFPMFIAYGFSMLGSIISHKNGIYYLLLLLNFASMCDTGAYFVGSFFGKHKLCPEISPKKTVEGAFGGIISSVIVSVILVFVFHSEHILLTLLITIPLCIVGMLGDLFASSIKRSVGLKDYGNLIPGHGGILDRFDSMLLISPLLFMFIEIGVI